MITKFRTYQSTARIDVVEVIRETGASVFIECSRSFSGVRTRREAKLTAWSTYHDTWKAAHAELTEKAKGELKAARRTLELAQSFADNVRGLKPPQEPAAPGEKP